MLVTLMLAKIASIPLIPPAAPMLPALAPRPAWMGQMQSVVAASLGKVDSSGDVVGRPEDVAAVPQPQWQAEWALEQFWS
eukprot:COSAG06_NODE_39719_length_409_cov_1.170968_1_plen_80_part_00